MSGWRLTATVSILWWIAAALNAAIGKWTEAYLMVLTGMGWAGWALEEWQNTANANGKPPPANEPNK